MNLIENQITRKTTGAPGYTIDGLNVSGDLLIFGPFKFYHPTGTQDDGDGKKYYQVPQTQVTVTRDPDFNLILHIWIVCTAQAVTVDPVYFDADSVDITPPYADVTGDKIIYGRVPADPAREINLNFNTILDDLPGAAPEGE